MEGQLLNIRKYRNYRVGNNKEAQFIIKKENEDQISNNYNKIEYKINSNGSRTCKNYPINENINRPYFSQSNNHVVYNPNNLDRNNYKKDEYFNNINKYYTQVSSNNKKSNYESNNEQQYNNDSSILKNDSKKFTNLSGALRYFNNKIALNNIFYDIYYEPNLGKKINLFNEFSSDKINLDNKNYRNYNEASNMNSRRLTTTTILRRGNLKTNSIWSNINKDLLLQKNDLKDVFLIERIKSKTPYKTNNRLFKNNLKSNNERENRKYEMNNNVYNEENKEDISISIKMKDNKELNKRENIDRHFLRKNINTSLNKSLKKSFEQENSKKKYLNKNKILINKKPNQIKNYTSSNTLKKNNSTKSSPNILNDFQLLKIRNLNLKSPIAYKDVSIFNSTYSKSGKIPKKMNQSLEYSLDKYSSINIINNNNNLNIQNEANKKNNKKNIPKISINLDENIKIKKYEKDEQNNNLKKKKNLNERQKEIKQNISLNNIKYNSINNNKNSKIYYIENNINNISINKKFTNPIYIKQNNNNIVFRKKVNKSPEITKKLNIYKSQDSHLDIKDNNDSIIKLAQEINFSNIKLNTYENSNKKIEKINLNQNSSNEGSRKIYIKQKAIKIIQQPNNLDKINKKRINKIIYNKNIDQYHRYKVNNNQLDLITKYYNYFIKYPKIKVCYFSKAYYKNRKMPRTKVCYISKVNFEIYITNKNKSICYYTKMRREQELLQPPININCYYTKNIVLKRPKRIENKIRKKRMKTKSLVKGKEKSLNDLKDINEEIENEEYIINDNEKEEDIYLENENEENKNNVNNNSNKKNEIDKINNRKIIINENSSIKKKLSPTSYNDDEFNEEENDDFRIASDEDDSNDKYKKRDFEKYNKTEGKEIIGGYDKFKMTNIEKTTKVIELLEKLQGKRKNENEEINDINYNDKEDNFNDIDSKSKTLKKNIYLGTDKLNEIFNNQKNNKYNYVNEIEMEDENNDLNYSNYNMENNDINNKKKNNTYKKEIDYEKISSIFDKLEEIFVKKKSSNKSKVYNSNNDTIENCKTPLKKGGSYINTKYNNLNIEEEYNNNNYDYFGNKNNIYTKTDIHEINDGNNNNEILEKKSNEKNEKDMSKYKEIFKKQQIISKIELLMNKSKRNNNNNEFYTPNIQSEIDSDMNINKDTPGNSKKMNKKIYTIDQIFSFKNKKLCLNNNFLPNEVINHFNEISKNIENKDSFKANYKDINMNSNNYIYNKNNIINNEKKESEMCQWARKDMTKEIEEAEKYIIELNLKMSKDNFKHEIIEILNTLTVDNYKMILNKMVEMLYLTENVKTNKKELKKTEYLLYNQCIFAEIILDKAIIEKGYVILYAKLCADLFIQLIKLVKDYHNIKLGNQLINGENLKTILTSECKQKFDECISISSYSEYDNNEKREMFLVFKKKFLGNMNFIAELINVKILSQTKGFEFLDILYKRYKEIKDNNKIKFLNLEGAITLLNKFGGIIMERKNPKHIQNLDNYIKDNIYPIISNNQNNNDNEGLPNYLKYKIINLIEKKKNNWKDSLYELSIIPKGKNNNISNNHDLTNSNINIDESLVDTQKLINDNNKDNEEAIIILLKNDIQNYVLFLNENNIFNKDNLKEYYNMNENNNINNEYDWSITEELIIKANNELEEIIRCYIEFCIDYVTQEKNIFYCNEYIKNIINYYSIDLPKDEIEKIHSSINDLYSNIEDICIDNYFMMEIMGNLLYILLSNNLFYFEDFDKFINEEKDKIIKISQVIKFCLIYSEDKYAELFNILKDIKLYNDNKDIFEKYLIQPLKNDYNIKLE